MTTARLFAASLLVAVVSGSTFAQAPTKPAEQPAKAPAANPPNESTPAKDAPAKDGSKPRTDAPADPSQVLGFTMKAIDGKDVNLSEYKGKVVLMVNVASNCGYTKQYDGLEKLYSSRKDKGFVIMGFPANNFGGQEPGSDADIAKFCREKHSVTFPIFSKISVKGSDQHALYKQLSSQPAPIGGDPKWNFTKFLVDREGKVVARYDSGVTPEDKEFRAKIDELLGSGESKPATTEKPADAKAPATPDKK